MARLQLLQTHKHSLAGAKYEITCNWIVPLRLVPSDINMLGACKRFLFSAFRSFESAVCISKAKRWCCPIRLHRFWKDASDSQSSTKRFGTA